jgi:hypothetical protein
MGRERAREARRITSQRDGARSLPEDFDRLPREAPPSLA